LAHSTSIQHWEPIPGLEENISDPIFCNFEQLNYVEVCDAYSIVDKVSGVLNNGGDFLHHKEHFQTLHMQIFFIH
jgi:hypothetical protein